MTSDWLLLRNRGASHDARPVASGRRGRRRSAREEFAPSRKRSHVHIQPRRRDRRGSAWKCPRTLVEVASPIFRSHNTLLPGCPKSLLRNNAACVHVGEGGSYALALAQDGRARSIAMPCGSLANHPHRCNMGAAAAPLDGAGLAILSAIHNAAGASGIADLGRWW